MIVKYNINRIDNLLKDSFENVCKWIEDIKNHACDRIEMVLVGNK